MHTLQEQFLASKGQPIQCDGNVIIQMDVVSIPEHANVKVSFLGASYFAGNGVAIKARGGRIYLSDGSYAETVCIWDTPEHSRSVIHKVFAPNRELRVWNVYRIEHSSGAITEDSWTGNAGMIVEQQSGQIRRYRCSNGIGARNFADLMFEVVWTDDNGNPGVS